MILILFCFCLIIFLFVIYKYLYCIPTNNGSNSPIKVTSNRSPTTRMSQTRRIFPSLNINSSKKMALNPKSTKSFITKSKTSFDNSLFSASENTVNGYTISQLIPSFNKQPEIKSEEIRTSFAFKPNISPKIIEQPNKFITPNPTSGFHYDIPGYDDTYTITSPSGYQFMNEKNKKKPRKRGKSSKGDRNSSHSSTHESRKSSRRSHSRESERGESRSSRSDNKRGKDQDNENNRNSQSNRHSSHFHTSSRSINPTNRSESSHYSSTNPTYNPTTPAPTSQFFGIPHSNPFPDNIPVVPFTVD